MIPLRMVSKRLISKTVNLRVPISTNPAMKFPCLDRLEQISEELKQRNGERAELPDSVESGKRGNEDPVYGNVKSGFELFHSYEPLFLDYCGVLPNFQIAYETWGKLNEDKSNAILIHTGLSASSHAHSSPLNKNPGWWEDFIGPNNKALDTNKWFLICTNVLGGCYGSTGPSSLDPADNLPYATRFPMLSVHDIIRAQNRLIKEKFGISKLYCSLGSSLGGMQSLCYGQLFPNEVQRVVSVSGCARSHPTSIAMRHAQRQVLMADPNWNRGFYYNTKEFPNRIPPHVGLKLSREIATISYRSGPEWESRFGSERIDDEKSPVLCSDFLIESYLDHQGQKFALEYDANSMLYLSKAMDLFDLSQSNLNRSAMKREHARMLFEANKLNTTCEEILQPPKRKKSRTTSEDEVRKDLVEGMKSLRDLNVLIIGVKSDALMPHWQQRGIYEVLGGDNNHKAIHIELQESQSLFGHDTFLLDQENVGGNIGKFLCNDL